MQEAIRRSIAESTAAPDIASSNSGQTGPGPSEEDQLAWAMAESTRADKANDGGGGGGGSADTDVETACQRADYEGAVKLSLQEDGNDSDGDDAEQLPPFPNPATLAKARADGGGSSSGGGAAAAAGVGSSSAASVPGTSSQPDEDITPWKERQAQEEADLARAIAASLQDDAGGGGASASASVAAAPACSKAAGVAAGAAAAAARDPRTSFRLTSIIRHTGSSAARGHYLCDVLGVDTGIWKSYNDTQVCEVAKEDVFGPHRMQDAYVLFYLHDSLFPPPKTMKANAAAAAAAAAAASAKDEKDVSSKLDSISQSQSQSQSQSASASSQAAAGSSASNALLVDE